MLALNVQTLIILHSDLQRPSQSQVCAHVHEGDREKNSQIKATIVLIHEGNGQQKINK